MTRNHNNLPLFVAASLAVHATLLWHLPDSATQLAARQRGDVGLQLSITRHGKPPAQTSNEETAGTGARERQQNRPTTLAAHAAPSVSRPDTTTAPETNSPEQPQSAIKAVNSNRADTTAGVPLQVQLLDALQPYFHYPLLARRRGWEGTVQVGLHIHADGRISNLRIVATSQYSVLDRAALASLERIEQVPGAVAWLNGQDSDIVIPVEYHLTDG